MNGTIESFPDGARCYWCGSPQVCFVCHHCGRLMCDDHKENETVARKGFSKALMARLGLLVQDDEEIARRYGIRIARVGLLHELLSGLRILNICNYEFDYEKPDFRSYANSSRTGFGYLVHQVTRWVAEGFGFPDWGTDRAGVSYHCRSCAHYSTYFSGYFIFSMLFLLLLCLLIMFLLISDFSSIWLLPNLLAWLRGNPGQIITPFNIVLFVSWLLVVALTLTVIYNHVIFPAQEAGPLGFIPIPGRIEKIQIEEQQKIEIRLDSTGKYMANGRLATGTLTIPFFFTRFDRVHYYDLYLEKARKLNVTDPKKQPLQAGFLHLGPHSWRLRSGDSRIENRDQAFQVRFFPHKNPLNMLINNPKMNEVPNPLIWHYDIPGSASSNTGNSDVPVQVILSIPINSFGQILQVELELTNPNMKSAEQASIESLELWFSHDLGEISLSRPEGQLCKKPGSPDGHGGRWQKLTWRKLNFIRPQLKDERGDNLRCMLAIEFPKPLQLNRSGGIAHRFIGKLELKVPHTLSGLRQVEVYQPWGEHRKGQKTQMMTTYQVDLDFDLNCLSIQTVEILKDEITKVGAMPGVEMVTRISDRLAKSDFFIKRIIENCPHVSKEGADRLNRYWDIVGRKYLGVFPVNFHIILIGEEPTTARNGSGIGKIKAVINVQGIAASDTDLKEKIGKVMDQLLNLLDTAMVSEVS